MFANEPAQQKLSKLSVCVWYVCVPVNLYLHVCLCTCVCVYVCMCVDDSSCPAGFV